METYRIMSALSFGRTGANENSCYPDRIDITEEADETDIPPEQFIASILVEIMNKHIGEEEAV